MAIYVYPAIFTQKENVYTVTFPDFSYCSTQGKNLAEGMKMAENVLSEMLIHLEDRKMNIPAPSYINDLKAGGSTFTTYVQCDTMMYRRSMKKMVVKKTLTIPSWLNDAALNAGLNFSHILQDALKRELDL